VISGKHEYCIVGLGNIGILALYFLRNRDAVAISRRGKNSLVKVELREKNSELWAGEVMTYSFSAPVKCSRAVLAVKAYDVAWSLSALKGRAESVIVLSNGLGHIEAAKELFGEEKSLAVSITYGLTSCGEFCADLKGRGDIIIGGMKGKAKSEAEEVARDFEEGGGEARAVSDIEPHLWLKGIINSAINPITALLRRPNGVLLENSYALKIARDAVQEGKMIAERKGISLPEDPAGALIKVAERTRENSSSMLQDVVMKRKTEIDYINGYIASEGERLGIDARTVSLLHRLIKAVEAEYLR